MQIGSGIVKTCIVKHSGLGFAVFLGRGATTFSKLGDPIPCSRTKHGW